MNPKQCKSFDRLKDLRCQGIPGHDGPHWGYDAGGHLIQWRNKKDKSPEWKQIGCIWIPPGSNRWISPVDMDKHYYLTIYAKNAKRRNAKVKKTGK